MENEPKYEESRILNSAKLIGEGAVMVSRDSGSRLEVTADQFTDAHTEMETDLGNQESRSKAYWEKIADSKIEEMQRMLDISDEISELIEQHKTPADIVLHFEHKANELEDYADDIVSRHGLAKR